MWKINSFILSSFLQCSKRTRSLSTLTKGTLIFADSGHGTIMDSHDQKIRGSRDFAEKRANRELGDLLVYTKSQRSSGESRDSLQTGNVGREEEESAVNVFSDQMGLTCDFPPYFKSWHNQINVVSQPCPQSSLLGTLRLLATHRYSDPKLLCEQLWQGSFLRFQFVFHIVVIIDNIASKNLSKNIKQTKLSVLLPQAVLCFQTTADFSFVFETHAF